MGARDFHAPGYGPQRCVWDPEHPAAKCPECLRHALSCLALTTDGLNSPAFPPTLASIVAPHSSIDAPTSPCDAWHMAHLTAADLRALKARHRIRTYRLAAAAAISPTLLGALLNERRPLDPLQADRILAVIERLAAQANR